jgi:hypothetical protein
MKPGKEWAGPILGSLPLRPTNLERFMEVLKLHMPIMRMSVCLRKSYVPFCRLSIKPRKRKTITKI